MEATRFTNLLSPTNTSDFTLEASLYASPFGGDLGRTSRMPNDGRTYVGVTLTVNKKVYYDSLILSVPLPSGIRFDSSNGALLMEDSLDKTSVYGHVRVDPYAISYEFSKHVLPKGIEVKLMVPVIVDNPNAPLRIQPSAMMTTDGQPQTYTVNDVVIGQQCVEPTFYAGLQDYTSQPLARALTITTTPSTFYITMSVVFPLAMPSDSSPSVIVSLNAIPGVNFNANHPVSVYLNNRNIIDEVDFTPISGSTSRQLTFHSPVNLAGKTLFVQARVDISTTADLTKTIARPTITFYLDNTEAGSFTGAVYGINGPEDSPFIVKKLRISSKGVPTSVLSVPRHSCPVYVDIWIRLYREGNKSYTIVDDIPYPYTIQNPTCKTSVCGYVSGCVRVPNSEYTVSYDSLTGRLEIHYLPDDYANGQLVLFRFRLDRVNMQPLPRNGIVNKACVTVAQANSDPNPNLPAQECSSAIIYPPGFRGYTGSTGYPSTQYVPYPVHCSSGSSDGCNKKCIPLDKSMICLIDGSGGGSGGGGGGGCNCGSSGGMKMCNCSCSCTCVPANSGGGHHHGGYYGNTGGSGYPWGNYGYNPC